MKKIALVFIFIIATSVLLPKCQKKAQCVDFNAEESSWIPYSDGQVVAFKGNLGGSILKITAKKSKDTSESNFNRTEGRNDCTRYADWWFTTTDSSLSALNVDLHNRTGLKSHIYWFEIEGSRQVESGVAPNTISKVINGTNYSDILMLTVYVNFDTVYYGKNVGYIAFHKKQTNEWFYKQ